MAVQHKQAEGRASDCVLKPVGVYPDTTRTNAAIVMSEVLWPDGTPHPTNSRATILDDPDTWFGFEQEYFLYKDGRPLGFPNDGFPPPQGKYYTGVGYSYVGDIAREIVDKHLDLCLYAGVRHEGINAEVAKGQWEFQIFGKGSRKAADDVWVARLFDGAPLGRITAWTSNSIASRSSAIGTARECTATFPPDTCAKSAERNISRNSWQTFEKYRNEHIAVYGPDNHLRLTGLHETQSIDKFNYGVGNRGASIRIPHSFVNNGYRGYLEDRRPNSAADPYKVASRILQTDRRCADELILGLQEFYENAAPRRGGVCFFQRVQRRWPWRPWQVAGCVQGLWSGSRELALLGQGKCLGHDALRSDSLRFAFEVNDESVSQSREGPTRRCLPWQHDSGHRAGR